MYEFCTFKDNGNFEPPKKLKNIQHRHTYNNIKCSLCIDAFRKKIL